MHKTNSTAIISLLHLYTFYDTFFDLLINKEEWEEKEGCVALSFPDFLCHHFQHKCHSVMSDSLWPHGLQPPGSSVHGILQARIMEWVAISFSIFSISGWQIQGLYMKGYDRTVFLRTSLASFRTGSKVWFKREAWPLGPVSISFSQSYVQLVTSYSVSVSLNSPTLWLPWNFVFIGHHK